MKIGSCQNLIVCLGLWLGATAAPGADETRPATLPAQAPPMSASYQILLTRSIFARDHRAAPVVRLASAPTTQPVVDATTLAEANLTLRGVAIEDGSYIAFFEDATDHHIQRVHVGESISHGVTTAMSLDGVDYASGGKTSRVSIGDTLAGGSVIAAPPPTTMPTAPEADSPALSGPKPSWWKRSRR